ncbi:MAG: DUF1996 domain-containing protein [Granulosicoccus sp.]|nr:DUF1996 domain-containing protein [Granulosicoccus sp.]
MRIVKPLFACLPVFFLRVLLLMAVAKFSMAAPGVTAPSPNSTLSGTTQTFSWTADDVSVERWWLYAGTSQGARNIANSGDLGSATDYEVAGIPVDGSTVHIRLWYFSSDRWGYVDSAYTAAVLNDIAAPAMISPADGSELTAGTADFEWRDNNSPVNYWWLYIGSSVGNNDLYNSGPSLRNQTSVTVEQLPDDNSTIYVRLWYRLTGSGWRFTDTTYTAGSDNQNNAPDAAQNLALIKGNVTRNTQYDNNAYRDVPASDIAVSDLTVNDDIYNEALLDTSNSGYFRVKCEVSHFAYDDPIVFPDQPGRAHLHMFFGNTDANAYSTFDSLLNSGTGTCNGEDLNRTAYWVPALLDSEGNALLPDQVMVYYKNDNFRLNGANELVNPFPDNLRMIAGNGAATSPQTGFTGDWQVQPAISFSCGPAYRSNDRRQALIPDCYGNGNHLEMQIAFPQCVNEAAGTYQSDQSHMSYSENGYYGAACPDSHSTDISSIMYRIFFDVADYGGSLTDLHLSSDVKMDRILPGGTTAHADWFGAWHPDAMSMWVENCNNTQADCETGLLDRDPATSLVLRKRGHYPRGYRAPAEELVKLCPGKQYDPNDPLRSVAMCRMN